MAFKVQNQDCNWWLQRFFGVSKFDSRLPGFSGVEPAPFDPEALTILKGHLQEALASVQAQEKAINEQMAPQTVEEAQTLENHLAAALDKVRRQKEELQKKADGGPG